MEITNTTHIKINKNRGWRGLAEIVLMQETGKEVYYHSSRYLFTFSPDVWEDLIYRNLVVVTDEYYYYVIRFNDDDKKLPRPEQQRSVLIKDFMTNVVSIHEYKKSLFKIDPSLSTGDLFAIEHYNANRNNHTVSDWNAIGLRVQPIIL